MRGCDRLPSSRKRETVTLEEFVERRITAPAAAHLMANSINRPKSAPREEPAMTPPRKRRRVQNYRIESLTPPGQAGKNVERSSVRKRCPSSENLFSSNCGVHALARFLKIDIHGPRTANGRGHAKRAGVGEKIEHAADF